MDQRLARHKLLLDVIGLAILALTLMTVLALASYNRGDPSFNTTVSTGGQIANWVGPFGAVWADLLIQGFGLAAYGFVGVLGAVAVCLFFARAPRRPFLLVLGGFLFMAGLCALLNQGVDSIAYRGQTVKAGGLWGHWVHGHMAAAFGPGGTAVLCATAILVGLIFVFQFTMEGVLQQAYVGIQERWAQGQARWSAWREAAHLKKQLRENQSETAVAAPASPAPAEEKTIKRRKSAEPAPVPFPVTPPAPAATTMADGSFDLGETLKSKFEARQERPPTLVEAPIPQYTVTDTDEPLGIDLSTADSLAEPALEPLEITDLPEALPRRETPPRFQHEALEDDISEEEVISAFDSLLEKSGAKKPGRSPKSASGGLMIEERAEGPAPILSEGALHDQPRRAFQLPPLDLLDDFRIERPPVDREFLVAQAKLLEEKFADFNIGGKVTNVRPGPVITLFEFKPAPGIKVSKIAGMSDDLALALSALSVRIIAPIPGKDVIGIEIPNKERETVYFKEMLATIGQQEQPFNLPIMLGKDTAGLPVMAQITKAPHLLVAGATGSGKSVFLNTLIASLLFECTPEQMRFLMVDPKMLELSIYNGIPHLLMPVITDPKKAVQALAWAVDEMERRYSVMAELEVRHIKSFNERVSKSRTVLPSQAEDGGDPSPLEPMPNIVVIIDEFADLMVVASKELELLIMRLAQKARAAGIHLVLATQRPSVNVITGVIKANLPTRIAFQVTSKVDSRTILDGMGAECLLGMGDMLYSGPATQGRPQRLHGAFINDDEVKRVVDFLRGQGLPAYVPEIMQAVENASAGEVLGLDSEFDDDDPKYDEAVQVVTESGKASISYVQRRLKIGYNRAARMIERMEKEGVIASGEPGKPREILARNYKE